MNSATFVQLALKTLSCTQKELASRLGVSPTQISKWKQNEHMSPEMEQKLRTITQIEDMDPELILWTGSQEQAKKWEQLVHYLAGLAAQNSETGYETYPLKDEYGSLTWSTLAILKDMGVEIPETFPQHLDLDNEPRDLEDDEAFEAWHEALAADPYADLIQRIYKSLTDLYGFYSAYVAEISRDDRLELFDLDGDIESCLIELAATKINVSEDLAPDARKFKHHVEENYTQWLTALRQKALRAGMPLRAELLDLVYATHDQLGQSAEAESLGLHTERLHPDIYMNELLVGMRTIHQVLPAIMKKLGIYDEFVLNTKDLRLGR